MKFNISMPIDFYNKLKRKAKRKKYEHKRVYKICFNYSVGKGNIERVNNMTKEELLNDKTFIDLFSIENEIEKAKRKKLN